MKRMFKAVCPYCGREVTGFDDWENGDICIQGFCDSASCGRYILEDEADWREVKEKTRPAAD